MNLIKTLQELYPVYESYDLRSLYETPKDRTMCDVALPCFQIAKHLQRPPTEIATQIANTFTPKPGIAHIVAVGPYVNFSFETVWLADAILSTILEKKSNYGAGISRDESIVIESPGPNTNKPLHLGHVRNMLLGQSLTNILTYAGYQVHAIDIINDRGIHICKSMLAYQLEGNNQEPNKKSDHFVGDRYVRYAQLVEADPALEQQTQQMLQQREAGDPHVRDLRKRMNAWAISGMQETYARYGMQIEKAYYESDHYLKGKELVEQGLTKNIFEKNAKGNIVYIDPQLGEKTVLRADGTAIYLTQDLALAQVRYTDRHMDRMIYVVGNEQEDHFKFLFRILERLEMPFASKCFHLSYGMISLPDGKMKSRQGNTVDADSLADQMHAQVFAMLTERYPELEETEKHQRAEKIALGAIKYFILKYEAQKDFVFDRESSLSFEGETGPYIQYAVARCHAIFRKAGWDIEKIVAHASYDLLTSVHEKSLIVSLISFPHIVSESAERYQSAIVARYALDLAHLIHSYYHHEKIIDSDQPVLQTQRLHLLAASQQVLSNALRLLGIETLTEM